LSVDVGKSKKKTRLWNHYNCIKSTFATEATCIVECRQSDIYCHN